MYPCPICHGTRTIMVYGRYEPFLDCPHCAGTGIDPGPEPIEPNDDDLILNVWA